MTRLRQGPWRALGLAALLLLPAAGAAAQDAWESPEHAACLRRAAEAPEAALEDALGWEAAGGGPAALHCQAVALIGSGEYARAAAILEDLPNALPDAGADGRAALLGEAGNAWILANDMPRAVAAFDAAIALVPGVASLHIDRALALALAGDYWAAIDDLNAAEDLAPDRADLLIFRATAYRLLEVYDLALADLERALQLDPRNPEAYLERGMSRRLTGDDAGARADWLKVLELDAEGPSGDAARRNLELLDVKVE
jgi:tetratricopeptide (TPR) repeat protein